MTNEFKQKAILDDFNKNFNYEMYGKELELLNEGKYLGAIVSSNLKSQSKLDLEAGSRADKMLEIKIKMLIIKSKMLIIALYNGYVKSELDH